MKIRNGFVSNSSSSSFVVMLPDGFDPETIVWESYANQLEDDMITAEDAKKLLNKLISSGEIYDEEDGGFFVLQAVLDRYIIAAMDVPSEAGMIVLADKGVIRRIQGEG